MGYNLLSLCVFQLLFYTYDRSNKSGSGPLHSRGTSKHCADCPPPPLPTGQLHGATLACTCLLGILG